MQYTIWENLKFIISDNLLVWAYKLTPKHSVEQIEIVAFAVSYWNRRCDRDELM